MFRILIIFPLLFSLLVDCLAQSNPDNAFIPPLDVPLKLSGTFGELRSDHFHSGIDLKTGEMEGLKVYAIADGYVSRIKVQSGGYGKALYITHPNGYVSVYAHLSKYNTTIDDYVRTRQYENRSYEINIYPEPDEFRLSQGDVIAYSGNSGRSGGPHLHFEVRGEADQKPVNPLRFNFHVTDNKAPLINMIKVYPSGPQSRVEGSSRPRDLFPESRGSDYSLKGKDTLTVAGSVLFGINTYDPFNGGRNKNGVYAIELFVDDKLLYGHKLESFSFYETRYINSLIDYKEYKTKRRRVQKSYVDPNNKLGIYTTKHSGGLGVKAGERYELTYRVSDFAGNVSELVFWIRGTAAAGDIEIKPVAGHQELFSYRHNNVFRSDGIELTVPGKALYDTMTFEYARLEPVAGAYSAVHRVHHDYVPLHSWCDLTIRPDDMDAGLLSKALIVKLEEGDDPSAFGGTAENGLIKTRIREFGDYCIMLDTVPPMISPVNIQRNKSLLAQHTIQVKITDELSGINDYNAYLDGKWILMEYDEKNDLLTYYFDSHLKDGENIFELVVTDERNNKATYKTTLLY
jgi:hypothetical protein